MPAKRHNELKAGIFAVLALAAGLGVLLWLGGTGLLQRGGARIYLYSPQADGNLGVTAATVVFLGGAPVGQVVGIDHDAAGARTVYEVRYKRPDVPIHADAQAQAVVETLGGTTLVLQTVGSAEAPPADRAHPARVTLGANPLVRQMQSKVVETIQTTLQDEVGYTDKQKTQFQQIIDSVHAASGHLGKILAVLSDQMQLRDDAMLGLAKAALVDLQKTSRNLADSSTALKAQLDASAEQTVLGRVLAFLAEAQGLAGQTHGLVKALRPPLEATVLRIDQYTDRDIGKILADLRAINTNILAITTDLQGVSATARDVVVLNRESLDDTLANLQTMATNLSAASREIRRNPWRLLQKPTEQATRSENIYDAARVFAEGASELESAVARLAALRQARPAGLAADDPELQRLREGLTRSFEKFRQVEEALWKELKQP